MINIKGIQISNKKTYEKIKLEIINSFTSEAQQIHGFIARAYFKEKNGKTNTPFEKDSIEYFMDILIDASSEKKYLSWFRENNETLFYKNISEIVHSYGTLKNAYEKSKKELKIGKTGTDNPFFTLFFNNEKNILIFKLNLDIFLNPYASYAIHDYTHKTKKVSFFDYSFFNDNDLFLIERKNKTLMIENTIEKKLDISVKKLKSCLIL